MLNIDREGVYRMIGGEHLWFCIAQLPLLESDTWDGMWDVAIPKIRPSMRV